MSCKITGIPRITMFTDDELKTIYEGALEVLETHGSIIPHEGCRKLLFDAGAKETKDGKKVLIPREIIRKAVETAPNGFKLYDRDGNLAMDMSGHNFYLATTCDAIDMIDPKTGERRKYVSDDWYSVSKVVDYLPNMNAMIINGCADDMTSDVAYRDMTYEVIKNTRVPIGLCMGDPRAIEEGIGVAEIVAGGPDKFKEKPNVYIHAEPVTPLEHHYETLEMVLLAAERGVPIVYYGMQMQGVTTPVTSAGTVVITIAETLVGLAIHQLKHPGAPFIFGGIPASMDMKSMIFSYGSPETVRNLLTLNEVGHYLNLPILGTTNTDAKTHDTQCGVEYALSMFAGVLAGHQMIHDVGFIDQSTCVSLHAMILCEEIFQRCIAIMEGVPVDADALVLDVIEDVGAGGNFLTHKHSLKRFKNMFKPYVFDRSSDYQKVKPFEDRIQKELDRILATHEVPALPDDILKALDEHKKMWNEKLKK